MTPDSLYTAEEVSFLNRIRDLTELSQADFEKLEDLYRRHDIPALVDDKEVYEGALPSMIHRGRTVRMNPDL